MGSGPFKFAGYEAGQSIKGVRNPDYFVPGLPYLDGFVGIYADKESVRIDALRADRASIEFRGISRRACVTVRSSRRLATRSRLKRATGPAAT